MLNPLCKALAAALLLSACAAQQERRFNDDWPSYQYDSSRSGAVEEGPRPPLKIRWTFDAESRFIHPPVVSQGTVYAGARNNLLYALDLASGSKRWEVELDQGGISSSPSLGANTIYAAKGEDSYMIFAWDTAGSELWSRQTGELTNRPPWVLIEEPTKNNPKAQPALYTHLDPALNSPEEILVQVAALNPANGETLWQKPLTGIPKVAPALSKDLYLVAATDEKLYAFDKQSGELKWQLPLEGEPASSPLVQGSIAYLSTDAGFLYAVDLLNGTVAWRYQFPDTILMGNLAFTQGLLLIPGEKYLYTYDTLELKEAWRFRLPQEITSPVVSNDYVYFGSVNHMLYVLKLETGQVAGMYRTNDEILASPVLAGGLVLVGSSDGKLYAFEEQAPVTKPANQPSNRWQNRR